MRKTINPEMKMLWDADDIAVWPDGTMATIGELRAGECSHMSDDYEIIRQDDLPRLRELGVVEVKDFEE